MVAILIKLLALSGLCSWVSSILPSTHPNSFIQLFLDIVNAVGGNFYKGKNADDARK